MDILKKIVRDDIEQTAIEKTYYNVKFPNGFGMFMATLESEHLVSSNFKRQQTINTIVWSDMIYENGIRMETTDHPYIANYAGDVKIVGSKKAIQLFERALQLHHVLYETDGLAKTIKYKLQYHKELNPSLWHTNSSGKYELDPNVRDVLKRVGEKFFDHLDLQLIRVEDIVITGSNANYNWTTLSDIDLHIIIDMESARKTYGRLLGPYIDIQKKQWNDTHEIDIKGLPVEFYVQDTAEKHYSTGIFSVLNNEWVVEPSYDKPTFDSSAVKAKVELFIKMIKKVLKANYDPDNFTRLMDKIRRMRKAGLEDAGEWSTENLAFKVLRDQGYLDKLIAYKHRAFDKSFSIEDEEELLNWTK